MDECVGADRLIVMSGGRVVADGKPAEVFANVELMEREGLSVPETTRLIHDLRREGAFISGEALDIEACAKLIAASL
jgi:ABC-type multidrug transport system ATPase subunit